MVETRISNGQRVIDRWNEVFTALSAEPRRQIVVSLLDNSPEYAAPLPESAINPNVPADAETVRRELHHCHLPLLAEMGFVEWENEPLVATRGPRFEEVSVVFEALHDGAREIPDPLVVGCQRLEQEQQFSADE